MSRFNDRQQNELQEITPHVRFDKHERILYGHDIAAMPSLVKSLVGNTTPDGVAQPRTEEELIALLKWVYRENIPVTPRAKASSGYGGVIPVKKGLVIDFYRLKNVVSFDKNDLTVTVEAGMTWEALDKQLKKEGFTIRLYPTSYPSSTAGGWLVQGGAGIGSYEYGYYRENVLSARVVFPNGDVKDFSGDELDLISEAEGVIIKKGLDGNAEVVILGFIPGDQRKLSYNFVFGLVMTIMKIAKNFGGHPYSTRMYFGKEADVILGKERLKK